MTLASKITFARIAATPLIVYLLLAIEMPWGRYLALFLFIITSLTDAMDGYFARRLKQVTNFGKFLDPLADKLLITSVLVCMVELRIIDSIPVIIIIAREFAVTGLRLIAAGEGSVIDASMWGKYKTVAQVVTVTILLMEQQFGNMLLWITVLITVYSGIDYFVKNRRVFEYDRN